MQIDLTPHLVLGFQECLQVLANTAFTLRKHVYSDHE